MALLSAPRGEFSDVGSLSVSWKDCFIGIVIPLACPSKRIKYVSKSIVRSQWPACNQSKSDGNLEGSEFFDPVGVM